MEKPRARVITGSGLWILALICCARSVADDTTLHTAAQAPAALGTATADTSHLTRPCLFCRQYADDLGHDIKHVLGAPLRWQAPEWQTFAAESTVVVGTLVFLDKPVRKYFDDHRGTTTDRVANAFDPFGTKYAVGTLGAFYLAGSVTDNPRAKNVALDGLTTTIIANGIIVPVLKEIAGRSRPSRKEGSRVFDTLDRIWRPRNTHDSFPSGHAAEAFAVATVLDRYYPNEPIVGASAYAVATLVGFSRIYHHAHFLSDIAAGAFIGTAVANTIVNAHQEREHSVTISPEFVPGAAMVQISIGF